MMKFATATTLVGSVAAVGPSFTGFQNKASKAAKSSVTKTDGSKIRKTHKGMSSPQLSLDGMLKNKIDMQEMMKMMPDMLAKLENMSFAEYKEAVPRAVRMMMPSFKELKQKIGEMNTKLEELASDPEEMKKVEEQLENLQNLQNDPAMLQNISEMEAAVKNGDMKFIEDKMKDAVHQQDAEMGDLMTSDEEDEAVEKAMGMMQAVQEMVQEKVEEAKDIEEAE